MAVNKNLLRENNLHIKVDSIFFGDVCGGDLIKLVNIIEREFDVDS